MKHLFRRVALLATLSFLLAGSLAATGGSPAAAQAADGPRAVHFLVDVSGSMSGTRIDEAKTALRTAGPQISAGTDVGLRSYEGSCSDPGELNIPIGPFDQTAFNSVVDALDTGGSTPTSAALRLAVDDFPANASAKALILISDGDDQCGDLCDTANEIIASGVDLTIQTVGIQVSGSAEEALECTAAATGGQYFSVTEIDDLTDAFTNAAADLDNDNVLDENDNCPNDANTDQADNDSDGIGNVCDPTPDGDPGERSITVVASTEDATTFGARVEASGLASGPGYVAVPIQCGAVDRVLTCAFITEPVELDFDGTFDETITAPKSFVSGKAASAGTVVDCVPGGACGLGLVVFANGAVVDVIGTSVPPILIAA